MNYRNKKLTQSAKNERCVSCGADDSTIVWAHSNSQKHGKGMGIKAHDIFGAYLCLFCHDMYDGRKKLETRSQQVYEYVRYESKGGKELWFNCMWEKSMIIACNKGYL